jgi:cell wall-associated NlpC family hydrolase
MTTGLLRPLPVFALVAAALAFPPATASTTPRVPYNEVVLSVAAGERLEERVPSAPRVVGVPERAATLALRMAGTPYRWGGESPGGFDCSGLIRWAYGQVGVDLPHNSHALYGVGGVVSPTTLETGDVLFFSGLGHVGLYLGGGWMVHAPQSGKTVEMVDLAASHYGSRLVGARRVVAN